jgi:hypothetical protein
LSRIIATPSGGPEALEPSKDLSPALSIPFPSEFPESQIDGLTTHFLDQTTEPIPLIAIMAGGLAYRAGRVGIMGLNMAGFSGAPLSLASRAGGLFSEVAAFELTHRALQNTNHPSPELWSWSAQGGLREGLLTSLIAFGTLRGVGAFAQTQNLVFQHLVQSSALVSARQASAALEIGPPPEGNLSSQFLNAEATTLQVTAGMGLSHRLIPGIHVFERGMELSLRNRDRNLGARPSFVEPSFAYATVTEPFDESLGRAENPSLLLSTHVFSVKNGLSGENGPSRSLSNEQARELKARFTPQFPSMEDPNIYSDEIIERALGTPSQLPHFHERLLEAISRASQRGTLSQRHTADAIKRTFHFDSLHTATGTLENALLQLLMGQMMLEENPTRRNEALHNLFQAMDQGLSRPVLEDLFSHWGSLEEWRSGTSPLYPPSFFVRHEGILRQELAAYPLRQKVQILNFLYQEFENNPSRTQGAMEYFGEARAEGQYDPADIDAAFQYARRVPFGRVVLRRMLSIFLTNDVPAKLRELTETPNPAHNTLNLVRKGRSHGIDPETLAKAINGSRHTAYLRDMRLARKVVAVTEEMASYFERPLENRQRDRNRFYQVIQTFLRSGAELTPEALMDLINVNPTLQTQRIRERWRSQAFQLRFPPDSEMDELLKKWRHVSLEVSHLFYGGEGLRPDQILMRPFPPPAANRPADTFSRNVQLTHHARGLVHESEHWSHFRGRFEGIEAGGEAFPILGLGREGRLTTEIMALLEDNQWVTLNVTDTDREIAQRLGLNLPLYFRALADHGYFGKTNERLAREW